jgi:hypothetical protein
MPRPVSVLAALAVGLLVLSECPTTDGAGRRGLRRGRCCTPCAPCCETGAPSPEAAPGYAAAPRSYDLVEVYCCCMDQWVDKGAYPPDKADAIVQKCLDDGCSSGFYSLDPMDIQGVPCAAFTAQRSAAAGPKLWYVYCCCNGCWRALGPFDNQGAANSAAQHCKTHCHCRNAIVAPVPINTSCLPCPGGCG